jgi:branched-chain amino acid transport system substrate-binding protein
MRTRTGTMRLMAVVVAAGLVAAACGDDDDSAEAPDATTGATTAETDPSTSDSPAGTDAPTTDDCVLDEPLKIGYAADFSEFGAFADQPGSDAAQVQIDLINEAGGVGGQPVEYVVKDILTDPSASQRVAQELLDEGVHAIIGPPFAYNGTPLLDTVDGQAPIIFMSSTDPTLAAPDRGGFLMSFSDPVQAAAAAEWARGQGLENAVTFSSPDDPYFSLNTEVFTRVFVADGGTVSRDFTFGLADEDFSSQVNELASLDPAPDALFTAMIMPATGVLLEQMAAAGLDDIQIIGADAFDATVVWSAGEVAEGVAFTAHTFPSDDNGVQEFLDATEAAGVTIETISFGALASDAVQVIAHAVRTACSLDGPTLIDTINGISDLEVTTGTVTYEGANGVPEKDVVILQVQDGEPALVDSFRPER